MADKLAAEKALLAKIKSDPELQKYAGAWDTISEVQRRKAERLGKGPRLSTRLFNIAQTLVQMAEEDPKPSGERLTEFRDSARGSLEQQLFSTAPIYKDLELTLLADSIAGTGTAV